MKTISKILFVVTLFLTWNTSFALTRTDIGSYNSNLNIGTVAFTTTSFTPPANSLLVIGVSRMRNNSAGPMLAANISGGGLSYTSIGSLDLIPTWGAHMDVFYALVGSSPSAMTITVSDPNSYNIASYTVTVTAFGSYNTSSPVGGFVSSGGADIGDGAETQIMTAIPSTSDTSLVYLTVDADNIPNPSWSSGWTGIYNSGQNGYASIALARREATASNSVSITDSYTAAGTFYKGGMISFFVKDSGSVTPPPPTPTPTPTPVPTVTLSATPTTITSGSSSTLTWSSTNATSCTASGGWSGTMSTSGSQSVTPSVTTSYTLSCTGAGGTVNQSTTITVNAVTPPPPTPTPNPPPTNAGYGLRFFGNGASDIDRVKIPLDNPNRTIDLGNDFTIEFWSKMLLTENVSNSCVGGNDNWITGNIVIDRDIWGNGDFGDYGVSFANGRVAFGINNGSTGAGICGTTNVADNNWHHIAVIRNSTSGLISIFVDGLLDGQGSGPLGNLSYRDGRAINRTNEPYIVLGAEKHDFNKSIYPSFSGYIDELRFSNSVRYTSNFSRPNSPFSVDSNTVALFHFDAGSGDVITDATGANNGTRYFGGSPSGPNWIISDAPINGTTSPPPPPPTPVDTTPPTISSISTSGITTSGITITWSTNESATAQVQYGLTTAYGSSANSGGTTSHSVTLSGLSANTVYNFRISATDTSGNTAVSTNQTFTTSAVVTPPPPTPTPPPSSSVDWTQFQNNPQHTGRSSVQVNPNYSAKWIWMDKTHIVKNFVNGVNKSITNGFSDVATFKSSVIFAGQMQPITVLGQTIFSSMNGTVYSVNATTGDNIWDFTTSGPIISTAAYDNGVVIVNSLSGYVYGINFSNGTLKWLYQTGAGISASPVVMNGTAYIGSRDGSMYAFDTQTGALKWKYDVRDPTGKFNKAPIVSEAAISEDGLTVLFGAENMYFYGLNSSNGTEKWSPKQMVGQSFLYSWPVVTGNIVIVRTMSSLGGAEFLAESVLDALPANPDWLTQEKPAMLSWLTSNSNQKSMYVLNINTGTEPYQVAMGRVSGENFTSFPPVLDNSGRLLTYWRSRNATFIQDVPCYGTNHCPDISAMNTSTGDRVKLAPTSPSAIAPELDNGYLLTVGGSRLYMSNHFRGTVSIDLSTGATTRITTPIALWDCGDFRGWGYQIIYYGNDSATLSCNPNPPDPRPGRVYSPTTGWSGISLAQTGTTKMMYVTETNINAIIGIVGQ